MNANYYFFKNKYFPSTFIEWDKLDFPNILQEIRFSLLYPMFKKQILEFIRPFTNSIFNICSSVRLNYLTRLQVSLSHLREHKFCHNFRDSLNPLCDCGKVTKTTKHFLLHCKRLSTKGRPF